VGPLVRTATTTRAVVAGRAGAALLVGSLLVAVPSVLAVRALVVGAGSPAPLALVAALVPVAIASGAVGRAAGAVGRLAARRLGLSGWTRALLGLIAVGALLLATQSVVQSSVDATPDAGGAIPAAALPSTAVLPGAPLQAYGGVALVPIGGVATPLGVAVAATLGLVAVGGATVAVRAEARLLEADEDDRAGTVASRGVPVPLDRSPSTRVAWRYLVRTRRNPATMSHLFPLAIGAFSFVGSLVATPDLAVTLGPGALLVAGGVLAGATYGLNPLGDDREQLPLILTSARSTATLLRGRAVAGGLIGLALVAVALPIDATVNRLPGALARTAVAVPYVASATGTALGLGAALPVFERREYVNVDRAHPSLLLLFGFLLGGTVVGGAGLGLATWSAGGADPALAAVGLTVYLAILAGTGVGGYVYAVRRFDGFDLDEV
jgi:hypothetical protein